MQVSLTAIALILVALPHLAAEDSAAPVWVLEAEPGVLQTKHGVEEDQAGTKPSLFPPFLEFDYQPLCQPVKEQVVVVNTNPRKELSLLALSSNSHEVHCTWFKEDKLGPGKNTSFSVIFLGNGLGRSEARISVLTSQGDLTLEVLANSVGNPTGVRPLISGRVPVNVTFEQVITVFNPLPDPLAVTEIYTSSRTLQLEVAGVASGSHKGLWHVPPFSSRDVVVLRADAAQPSVIEGFVNIRTNVSQANSVIPVMVEAANSSGLYFGPSEALDFGVISDLSERARDFQVMFADAEKSKVKVTSIELKSNCVETAADKCPQVTVTMVPTSVFDTNVWIAAGSVNVTFRQRFLPPGEYRGLVSITYEVAGSDEYLSVQVPWVVQYVHGALDFPRLRSAFFVGQPPFSEEKRKIKIVNTLNQPVLINGAELPHAAQGLFKAEMKAVALRPNASTTLTLTFKANSSDLDLETHVQLNTNLADTPLLIPVYAYNGRLFYFVANDTSNDVVDFGTVSTKSKHETEITILNQNPVKISVLYFSSSLDNVELSLLRREPVVQYASLREYGAAYPQMAVQTVSVEGNTAGKRKDLTVDIEAGHAATFTVTVQPTEEGKFSGEVVLVTSHQVLHIPIAYSAVRYVLNTQPTSLVFHSTFPGIITDENGKRRYLRDVELLNLSVRPDEQNVFINNIRCNDPRVTFRQNPDVAEGIVGTEVLLGHVGFDPNIGNVVAPYMPTVRPDLMSTDLTKEDIESVVKARRAWAELEKHNHNNIKTELVVDSNLQSGHTIPIKASLALPSIVLNMVTAFPLTQVKHASVANVTVINPSSLPVAFRVESIDEVLNKDVASVITEAFGISDKLMRQAASTKGAFAAADHRRVHAVIPDEERVQIIRPYTAKQVPIRFKPEEQGAHNTVLLVRNNLTVVETIYVNGSAGKGSFGFPKSQPHIVNDCLTFNIRPENLTYCSDSDHPRELRSFTFPFIVVNRGNMAVQVESLGVSGHPCEAYGFKIMNCEPFSLGPRSQKTLDISYTPDFTAHVVKRKLTVQLQGAERQLHFSMHAILPESMTADCFDVVPGPEWETKFKWGVVVCVVLLCGLVAASEWFHRDLLGTALGVFKRQESEKTSASKKSRAQRQTSSSGSGKVPVEDHGKPQQQHQQSAAAVAASASKATSSNGKGSIRIVPESSRRNQGQGQQNGGTDVGSEHAAGDSAANAAAASSSRPKSQHPPQQPQQPQQQDAQHLNGTGKSSKSKKSSKKQAGGEPVRTGGSAFDEAYENEWTSAKKKRNEQGKQTSPAIKGETPKLSKRNFDAQPSGQKPASQRTPSASGTASGAAISPAASAAPSSASSSTVSSPVFAGGGAPRPVLDHRYNHNYPGIHSVPTDDERRRAGLKKAGALPAVAQPDQLRDMAMAKAMEKLKQGSQPATQRQAAAPQPQDDELTFTPLRHRVLDDFDESDASSSESSSVSAPWAVDSSPQFPGTVLNELPNLLNPDSQPFLPPIAVSELPAAWEERTRTPPPDPATYATPWEWDRPSANASASASSSSLFSSTLPSRPSNEQVSSGLTLRDIWSADDADVDVSPSAGGDAFASQSFLGQFASPSTSIWGDVVTGGTQLFEDPEWVQQSQPPLTPASWEEPITAAPTVNPAVSLPPTVGPPPGFGLPAPSSRRGSQW